MKYVNEFGDQRQKWSCVQCGVWTGAVETNRDHVPSKGLLRRPLPDNLPVVATCTDCNNSFSVDEEYLFLFLNCVLVGSTDPDRHADGRVSRALRHHTKLKGRIENSKTIDDASRCVWTPEVDRVKRIVVKNARGHAFYECGEPIFTAPDHVWTAPLETLAPAELEEFENGSTTENLAGWPEVGSRMMIRLVEGPDLRGGWVVVQENVYRYRTEQCGLLLIKSVLFEYLATEVYWRDN